MSDQPPEPRRERVTLEVLAPDRAEIRGPGEGCLLLSGAMAVRVIDWYRHQLTHGAALAETYLMGFVHGAQYGVLMWGEETVERVRARRETGEN